MFKIINSILGLVVCCFFAACSNEPVEKKITDTPTSGTINISVDESFKPVI